MDDLERQVLRHLRRGTVPERYERKSRQRHQYTLLQDHHKDTCTKCGRVEVLLQRMTSLPEETQRKVKQEIAEHKKAVKKEYKEYSRVVKKSKAAADGHRSKPSEEPGTSAEPCRPIFAHYSFDFGERVHCPHDGSQPKKYYDIFGVVSDALCKMDMFLIDGALRKRLNANTVISLLHFFFENYGLKEGMSHLHADKCRGQNKNNVILWYLMWRVMEGRHKSITLSFLLAGHTKFGPNLCFDLFKQHYLKARRTGRVKGIAEEVKASSPSGMLIPHLVSEQDDNLGVIFEDWTTFLSEKFKKLKGLDMYHHFEFKMNDDEPEIHHRETVDGTAYIFLPRKTSVQSDSQTVKKAMSAVVKGLQSSSFSDFWRTLGLSNLPSTFPQPSCSSPLLPREEQYLSNPSPSPLFLQPSGSSPLPPREEQYLFTPSPSPLFLQSSGSSPLPPREEQYLFTPSPSFLSPKRSGSSPLPPSEEQYLSNPSPSPLFLQRSGSSPLPPREEQYLSNPSPSPLSLQPSSSSPLHPNEEQYLSNPSPSPLSLQPSGSSPLPPSEEQDLSTPLPSPLFLQPSGSSPLHPSEEQDLSTPLPSLFSLQPSGSSPLLPSEEQDLSTPSPSPLFLQRSGSSPLPPSEEQDLSTPLPSLFSLQRSGSSPLPPREKQYLSTRSPSPQTSSSSHSGFREMQSCFRPLPSATTSQPSSSSFNPSQQVGNQAVKRKWQDDKVHGLNLSAEGKKEKKYKKEKKKEKRKKLKKEKLEFKTE